MELFTINRYTEEDDTEKPKQNEAKVLKKLLAKIKKRKRKLDKQKSSSIDANLDQSNFNVEPSVEPDDSSNQIEPSELVSDKIEADTQLDKTDDDLSNFQVLGDDIFKKKEKINMLLPSWLSHPTIISQNILNNETKISVNQIDNLNEQIILNLKSMGIENLFPVQQVVIPWLLNVHRNRFEPFRPRDICVSAPTGSGKTLAFAVPIVELLLNRIERKIRALVVLPVNELAVQVFQVFKKLIKKTNLTICLLSKLSPFPKEQQALIDEYNGKYYSKVDIVITTPGRLVEHLHSTKGFNLNDLKFLVIDEADKIMEQIHHNWLYHLDEHVKTTSDFILGGNSMGLCLNELMYSPKQPHKMLFSATLSQDPEKLNNLKLFQPKLFTSVISTIQKMDLDENTNVEDENSARGEFIGKYTTPAELSEKYCITELQLKPLTLYSLIEENNWRKFLCFTNSAEGAHRLAFVLDFLCPKTRKIAELSSTLTQKKRTDVLDLFSRGKINGLICSDALARGIDIPEVDIVISYDVPRHIKTYIHRIGRTARAGRPGTAITLLAQNELKKINQILNQAGKELYDEIKVEPNMEEKHTAKYTNALKSLEHNLQSEKKMKIVQKHITKSQAKNNYENKTEALSLMESLQQQADSKILSKFNQRIERTENKVAKKFRKNVNKQLKKIKRKEKLKQKKEKKIPETKKIKKNVFKF